MAQSDERSVIVYQAYRPSIGLFAAEHQFFGGDFSFTRMSWIKTNFLWMMYRSGWGTKDGQEVTLAIELNKSYFEDILKNAYPSTNILGVSHDDWKNKLAESNVRLQWDPDHKPDGSADERRAIQLGLRNEYLAPFSGDGIHSITDISDFVAEQRCIVESRQLDKLLLPSESVYEVTDEISKVLGMY